MCIFGAKHDEMDTRLDEVRVNPYMVRKMISTGEIVGLEDRLVVARCCEESDFSQLGHPFYIDSYLAAYCHEGTIRCSVNLNEYTLCKGMLMVVMPGNIVQFNSTGGISDRKVSFSLINVTTDFFQNSGIDLSNVIQAALEVLRNPCILLSDKEYNLLERYFDIVEEVIKSRQTYVTESVRAIMTSVFYQFAGFLRSKMNEQPVVDDQKSTRQRLMFEQFMKLASTYYVNERQMQFYADKMCVTPKYLSKVVKDVSGKSGPQWIDELVILSAKNLLKHSELSIKEVAAVLNFPNQSFFFKFFKNKAGRTPSQYRQE